MPATHSAAIFSVLEGLAAAWNAGDAQAYAALFTPDATYITFAGDVLDGAEQIRDIHQFLFRGPLAGSRMDNPASGADGARPHVREVAPGVAHVVTGGAVNPHAAAGEPVAEDRASVQSFLFVRGDNGWRIAAFHNTRRTATR